MRINSSSFIGMFLFLAFVANANANAEVLERLDYPERPDLEMTPGSYCVPDEEPENPEYITHCKRDVSSETKWKIIEAYDEKFGFDIASSDRSDFKIDHLIPLCLGGSNELDNLWPQHKTIFKLTDPLEPELCGRVSFDSMTQAEAAIVIRHAKQNPHSAPQIYCDLTGRRCDGLGDD